MIEVRRYTWIQQIFGAARRKEVPASCRRQPFVPVICEGLALTVILFYRILQVSYTNKRRAFMIWFF